MTADSTGVRPLIATATLSRRDFLRELGLLSGGLGAGLLFRDIPLSGLTTDVSPVQLKPLGSARQLTPKVFGASAESLIEPLLQNPREIAAIKATAPAMVRFPGGSQSNYYNWRTGLLDFNVQPNSSAYVKYWAAIQPKIAKAFPNGVKYEEYAPFAASIGADTVLVPNLETSTVEEQTAWFTQIKTDGLQTKFIELGNEFYLAMAGDPASLARWPDEPTAIAVMQRYVIALRPLVDQGAKFAIQSAASSFDTLPSDPRPFYKRMLAWDAAMKPADWFDAVTAHLYPEPDTISAAAGGPTAQKLFELMMARIDGGGDRVLNDIVGRLPGKDIWVTEWNPRGGSAPDPTKVEKVTPPMALHLTTRYLLMFLRHPAVTKSLFFMLNATDGTPFQAYVRGSSGDYAPVPATVVLGWFTDAANSGGNFQRFAAADGKPVAGLSAYSESYLPVEGALFKNTDRVVLILQNASADTRTYDPTAGGTQAQPKQIDLLVAGDFGNSAQLPAIVVSADVTQMLSLPPFSVARIIW